MRKIIYIANVRLPTEKAHGIQIMKTCESLAKKWIDVLLVVPIRRTHVAGDPFDYYGVAKNFRIIRLPSWDAVWLGRLGFLIQTFTFIIFCAFRFSGTHGPFYTRDESIAWYLSVFGKECAWEAHRGGVNFFTRALIRLGVKIVVISDGLKKLYISLGTRPENILVARDGVHVEDFSLTISKAEARVKTGLPSEAKIVLYTGHLYEWKGADTLASAASKLPSGARAVFVGGTDDELSSFRKKYGNLPQVMVLGRKPHADIPYYLKSADVLVLPNSAKEDISRLYTSPLKLFEYMASGVPIVASDLPSIKEVLNKGNAALVKPDNPDALAAGIIDCLNNPKRAGVLAKQAEIEVMKHSWAKRAGMIINFLPSITRATTD